MKTVTSDTDLPINNNVVVLEVPLVNISDYMVPADKPLHVEHEADENFNKYFDVTPR